ncbi:MAG: uroporphyrinogen decarboxylase family protein [Anaerolineae bacterium]
MHQEPDRVPLDMTITSIPYVRLREHLGLPPEENLKADRFGEVIPGIDLLEALGIDIIPLKLRPPDHSTAPPPAADGTVFDEWGVGRQRIDLPRGGFLLEVTHSPLKGLDPHEIDLDAYPWPDPHDPGRVRGLEAEARNLYEHTGLALMGRFGGTIMEMAAFIRGYEDWMMDLVMYPQFAIDLMNHIADVQIALDEAGIRAAGRFLSIFKLSGEDLGMQDRPLFSQKVWQEVLRPVLSRRWKAARAALDRHDARHVKLLLHSDGAIRSFIPDLIADGVDALDPIQVHCAGMELAGLKRDFGEYLTFHGAIDTQQVLNFGTPGTVEAEVKRVLRDLGPGGGLIVAPVHNVQPDVPPENIAAMCRAVHEYGRYPLKL